MAMAVQSRVQAQRSHPLQRASAPRARPVSRRALLRVGAYLETKPGAEAPPTPKAANQLDAFKQMSTVVADTGEIEAMKLYRPVDCTTNPSLVLKAMQLPEYHPLLLDALANEKKVSTTPGRPYALVADRLAVNIGAELLKLVPGRVSTEADAHLSYDTRACVDKALRILDLYAEKGIDPSRIYIKLASTWEGIRACEALQKQGIDCNMTLLFSFAQACACADAGAALISPFVGRILDWYKAAKKRDYTPQEDPGVLSVRRIYQYYKQYGYGTIVMAASFRNVGEIRELAGCDNITIAPALLKELEQSTEPLPYKLWPEMGGCTDPHMLMGADAVKLFEQMHNEDRMAVEKLKEGILGFSKDQHKLEEMIAQAAQ